eukprot:2746499-Rhodomonas_salina.1
MQDTPAHPPFTTEDARSRMVQCLPPVCTIAPRQIRIGHSGLVLTQSIRGWFRFIPLRDNARRP